MANGSGPQRLRAFNQPPSKGGAIKHEKGSRRKGISPYIYDASTAAVAVLAGTNASTNGTCNLRAFVCTYLSRPDVSATPPAKQRITASYIAAARAVRCPAITRTAVVYHAKKHKTADMPRMNTVVVDFLRPNPRDIYCSHGRRAAHTNSGSPVPGTRFLISGVPGRVPGRVPGEAIMQVSFPRSSSGCVWCSKLQAHLPDELLWSIRCRG